jgi:geranylgeranyl diphosphate synthase type II
MRRVLEEYVADIDKDLERRFTGAPTYAALLEAMRYSLLAGGKRVRAVLVMEFARVSGAPVTSALDAACAVEMLHAYSLIHDDLPCMDDSDMRRGKPSNHKVYGEWMATLAGDALQAAAFETLLSSPLPPDRLSDMALSLARAAGPDGICGGQVLDMAAQGHELAANRLREIHARKTSALFIASARIGAQAAGAPTARVVAAGEYAEALGLAFQVRDDLLDLTSDSRTLGKPARADADNMKCTFATLLGRDECERVISEQTRKAASSLSPEFEDAAFLIWFAEMLAGREK